MASWYGYAGYFRDPVVGGFPLGNGYRVYLPELMRFAAQDNMSPFGAGGINPYSYCGAEPANHVDPSGMSAFGWEDFLDRPENSWTGPSLPIDARNAEARVSGQARAEVSVEPTIRPGDKSDPRLNKLAAHIEDLKRKPDTVLHSKRPVQNFPSPGTVFGFRRNIREDIPAGDMAFELYDLNTLETVDTQPHGKYLFVNRIDEPHVVRVALSRRGIIGHTSLAIDDPAEAIPRPVYFAGELRLNHGELIWFNNGSNHYLPPADVDFLERGGTPWRRRLLPRHLAAFLK